MNRVSTLPNSIAASRFCSWSTPTAPVVLRLLRLYRYCPGQRALLGIRLPIISTGRIAAAISPNSASLAHQLLNWLRDYLCFHCRQTHQSHAIRQPGDHHAAGRPLARSHGPSPSGARTAPGGHPRLHGVARASKPARPWRRVLPSSAPTNCLPHLDLLPRRQHDQCPGYSRPDRVSSVSFENVTLHSPPPCWAAPHSSYPNHGTRKPWNALPRVPSTYMPVRWPRSLALRYFGANSAPPSCIPGSDDARFPSPYRAEHRDAGRIDRSDPSAERGATARPARIHPGADTLEPDRAPRRRRARTRAASRLRRSAARQGRDSRSNDRTTAGRFRGRARRLLPRAPPHREWRA